MGNEHPQKQLDYWLNDSSDEEFQQVDNLGIISRLSKELGVLL
jgi:hypothetical protein